MPGFYFETSLPKALGGVGSSFIVLLLMSKVVLPFALNVLAWKERKAARRPANAVAKNPVYDPEVTPVTSGNARASRSPFHFNQRYPF